MSLYKSGQRPWRSGAWLVMDEESGVMRYSDEITRDYRGHLVTKRYADSEHPQDFVKGLNDPRPIPFSNPYPTQDVCNYRPPVVGVTQVTAARINAADHLFDDDGIGTMEIGCTFVIYPHTY